MRPATCITAVNGPCAGAKDVTLEGAGESHEDVVERLHLRLGLWPDGEEEEVDAQHHHQQAHCLDLDRKRSVSDRSLPPSLHQLASLTCLL